MHPDKEHNIRGSPTKGHHHWNRHPNAMSGTLTHPILNCEEELRKKTQSSLKKILRCSLKVITVLTLSKIVISASQNPIPFDRTYNSIDLVVLI